MVFRVPKVLATIKTTDQCFIKPVKPKSNLTPYWIDRRTAMRTTVQKKTMVVITNRYEGEPPMSSIIGSLVTGKALRTELDSEAFSATPVYPNRKKPLF